MSGKFKDVEHWSGIASKWIGWARHPDYDAFWAYQAAFERFIGTGSGKGLEIGAGEGRISRTLQALGYDMTLAEPVPAFLDAARQAASGSAYLAAPGHALPTPSDHFALVVLYNVLMDVEDLTGTLREAARVLHPDGEMMIGLVHPFADLVQAHEATASWEAIEPYFDVREFDIVADDRDGPDMHFRGWSRPVSTYINAMLNEGLQLSAIEEPRPDPDHPWTATSHWDKLPLFLWLKARKSGPSRVARPSS